MSKTSKGESASFSGGLVLLVLAVAVGWLVGDSQGGDAFDWLLFSVFAAAGLICFAVGVAGQAIVEAIRSND